MRQGSHGVYAVPPGVSSTSFGVCLEASIERQGDFRFDILESDPQTLEQITPIIRRVRNKAIKQYWNKKYREVSLYKPIGKNGDERFTLESDY